ncbi:hypothetical protein BROUX41_000495 [Berkeleyomyces rouxiae]
MSSVASDLEKHFGVLVNSKPPGSQRGQVEAITALSESNIESESVVVSALVRYLKRAPITHKLGAVYIFDSVLRKWIEKAKAQGQPEVSSADEHGTFAAGVARIRDVIEPLVLDVIRVCPPDQREKIKRLVTIWDRSGALPSHMISTFLKSLEHPPEPDRSTTPQGSPPPGVVNGIPSRSTSLAPSATATPPIAAPAAPAAAASAFDSASSILSRLAAIAHNSNNSTPTPVNNAPAAPPSQPVAPAPVQAPAPIPAPVQPPAQAPQVPAYNGYYAGTYGTPAPVQNATPVPPASTSTIASNNAAAVAFPPAQAAALATLMNSIPALQGGFPNAGAGAALNPAIAAILQTLALGNAQQQSMQPQQNATQFGFGAYGAAKPGVQPPTGPQADRDYGRSPPRQRGRSRSPSAGNAWQRNNAGNGGYNERKGGKNEYRERSPTGNRAPAPVRPRWIEYDKSLPENHIRVYSRTLFIGGVNYSDSELHNIFAAFGEVQSCIVNKDKRHAFVKMLYRDMAAHAMDQMKSPEYQHYGLRTRWGVGFGPRDCSDYNTGISVIPISALTDADLKWMHTAKFGGCGDTEITSGMCIEEPDIEIGAGVSSKAISRRIQTDRGGSFGPRSTRAEPGSQQPPQAPAAQTQPPTQPQSHNNHESHGHGFRGGHGGHDGASHHGLPTRGGRGRGGFRDRGRPRRDFDTPQQFGQGFDYGANY